MALLGSSYDIQWNIDTLFSAIYFNNLAMTFVFSQMEAGVDTRVRVMILGGLYGSQPVGRELVLRLARHLASGWAKKNREIQKLLQNTKIFLVPAVDTDGFEKAEPGNRKFAVFLHVYHKHWISRTWVIFEL